MVALKLKDGIQPISSDSYEDSELVTYAEAKRSTNPKPYIAATVLSSSVDGNMFVLGDERNTSEPTTRKRRSTTSDYFNGPLEPGASYTIFQRVIFNCKVFMIGNLKLIQTTKTEHETNFLQYVWCLNISFWRQRMQKLNGKIQYSRFSLGNKGLVLALFLPLPFTNFVAPPR